MKNKILCLVIIISIYSCKQNEIQNSETNNSVLPIEVIKVKNPSRRALKEIYKITSFDSTYNKTVIEYANKNGNTIGFKYDLTPYYNYLKRVVESNDDIIIRQFAALQIPKLIVYGFNSENIDSSLKEVCLDLLKPDDIIWKVETNYSLLIYSTIYTNYAQQDYIKRNQLTKAKQNEKEKLRIEEFTFSKQFEYYERILNSNPDKVVRTAALIRILEIIHLYRKYELSEKYYKKLKNDFSDLNNDNVQNALLNYNPFSKLKNGNILPKFNFRLIETQKVISTSSMLGKYYLIQIWATWCSPCLKEIPMIRRIYEKYKNKNLEIISLSLDNKIEKLKKYWKLNGNMPWKNVLIENGFDDDFIRELGVTGVPILIFVGKDGKILECNFNSEEEIMEILNKYLFQ